jgi:hypothetical protein
MMKTAPSAIFEVAQAEFLFQFFVIAFDDPALFRSSDQFAQSGLFRQVRQPVFAWFAFVAGPLDQKPLLLSRMLGLVVPMCSADAYGSEAGAQRMTCAFAPCDGFPGF